MESPPLLPRTARILIALTLMACGCGLLIYWRITHGASPFAPDALPSLLAGLILDVSGVLMLIFTVARKNPQ